MKLSCRPRRHHRLRAERFESGRGRDPAASSIVLAVSRQAPNRDVARLLRPPAIVPDVGAIYPRHRPPVDNARGAFQRFVWKIDVENNVVAFDAISKVAGHGTIP